MTIRDEISDEVLHHYRLEFADGGILAVRMPGGQSQSQAVEIVDQLRDLAFAVATSAGLSEHEALAREDISRRCEQLGRVSDDVADLPHARKALQEYARFREAVSEFIGYAGR